MGGFLLQDSLNILGFQPGTENTPEQCGSKRNPQCGDFIHTLREGLCPR
jgi:hypothetical protein